MKTSSCKFAAVTLAAVAAVGTAYANHSWAGYHWARTANPFTLQLGRNVDANWTNILTTTAQDWTKSTVLDLTIVNGGAKPRNCRPTAGRVEVCNSAYGSTGWLGVAQVWASGTHITQGTVKLNDSYFNTSTYNSTAWRNLVSCQEVGHTLGLDHQDENFSNPNLGTCMDYTNDPSTNQHPNQHDYDELITIYSHADTSTTVSMQTAADNLPAAMKGRDFDRESSWGQLKKRSRNGALETYERDFGNGHKLVTHVFWALSEGGPADRQQRRNED